MHRKKKQGEHPVWTVGNGDPMQEVCIPHGIPRTWEQQGVGADTGVTEIWKKGAWARRTQLYSSPRDASSPIID